MRNKIEKDEDLGQPICRLKDHIRHCFKDEVIIYYDEFNDSYNVDQGIVNAFSYSYHSSLAEAKEAVEEVNATEISNEFEWETVEIDNDTGTA